MEIFDFNHISPLHSKEELAELKKLYSFYHKKNWCFRKLWKKKNKKRNLLLLNLSSALLVSLGTIAGGVTLNPAILGSLTSAGVLLKMFAKGKAHI